MTGERALIVVDVETTSLDYNAAILEVAAINVNTGEEMYFAPYVDRQALVDADPDALRINRYYERGVYQKALSPNDTGIKYMHLQSMLRGNTLGGSNPTFDAERISRVTWNQAQCLKVGAVWHHRLADLAAYAGGALGLQPHELMGLADVCYALSVTNTEPHSALGDARATAACFSLLAEKYAEVPV